MNNVILNVFIVFSGMLVMLYLPRFIFKFPKISENKEDCLSNVINMKFRFRVKLVSFTLPIFFIVLIMSKNNITDITNVSSSEIVLLGLFVLFWLISILFAWNTSVRIDNVGIYKKNWYGSKKFIAWRDIYFLSISDSSVKIWNKKGFGDVLVSSQLTNFVFFSEQLHENVPKKKWSEDAIKIMPKNND